MEREREKGRAVPSSVAQRHGENALKARLPLTITTVARRPPFFSFSSFFNPAFYNTHRLLRCKRCKRCMRCMRCMWVMMMSGGGDPAVNRQLAHALGYGHALHAS